VRAASFKRATLPLRIRSRPKLLTCRIGDNPGLDQSSLDQIPISTRRRSLLKKFSRKLLGRAERLGISL
jgi:hypothetical protein